MPQQGFDQALFAELLVGGVVGFGDAVGVESKSVTQTKLTLSNFAIPILEDSQHRGGGLEALDGVIAVEQKSGEMAAIGIAQAACRVVVFGEEEGGEGAVGSVVAKELVHGAQEALRLIQSDGALAAEIGLQIGHQESGGDSFSGDVADDEAEAVAPETEEVVVITTDFAGLNTKAGVFEGFERWLLLREEPGLDLLGDFDFLRSATFGIQPLGKSAALGFDGVGDLVETHERKGIAVKVLETGKDTTPDWGVLSAGSGGVRGIRSANAHLILEALQSRRELETNSTLAPFAVLRNYIFGDKGDRHRLTN